MNPFLIGAGILVIFAALSKKPGIIPQDYPDTVPANIPPATPSPALVLEPKPVTQPPSLTPTPAKETTPLVTTVVAVAPAVIEPGLTSKELLIPLTPKTTKERTFF